MKACFILFLCLILFSIPYGMAADVVVTATGQSTITGGTTYNEAKQEALMEARQKAVEKAVGIKIINISLMVDNLAKNSFLRADSNGYIIDEKLNWDKGWLESPGKAPIPLLKVDLTATIRHFPTSVSRPHLLDVAFADDKTVYQHGDRVDLRINAKHSMLLMVANYTDTGRIRVLFPNAYDTDYRLDAGEVRRIPGPETLYDITVETSHPQTVSKEAFFVVGLPVSTATRALIENLSRQTDDDMGFTEFFKQLTDAPFPWIAEKMLIYTVADK